MLKNWLEFASGSYRVRSSFLIARPITLFMKVDGEKEWKWKSEAGEIADEKIKGKDVRREKQRRSGWKKSCHEPRSIVLSLKRKNLFHQAAPFSSFTFHLPFSLAKLFFHFLFPSWMEKQSDSEVNCREALKEKITMKMYVCVSTSFL